LVQLAVWGRSDEEFTSISISISISSEGARTPISIGHIAYEVPTDSCSSGNKLTVVLAPCL
jgi:hypothetical protein